MAKLHLADATIAYTDTGRGTPVVLVHGARVRAGSGAG